MNVTQWLKLITLSTLGWGTLLSWGGGSSPAIAQTFGQEDIADSSRVIILAAPSGEIARQLLILEQLNNSRPCWQDRGGPVDALLLDFDFTGICRRSTDSNGYSLRMGGHDLGLDYILRVVQQDNDLLLVASSRTNFMAPPLVIGRAHDVPQQFVRIDLNPGWRLTRRTYEGTALGHFYLTHDLDVNTYLATMNSAGAAPVVVTPSPSVQPSPSSAITVNVVDRISLTPTTLDSQNAEAPLQVPTPPPLFTSPAPPPASSTANWIEFDRPTPSASAPLSSAPAIVQPSNTPTPLIPVSQLPPLVANSSANGLPGSGSAPVEVDLSTALGSIFRVVVPANNPQDEDRVRGLVPEAFPIVLNGQVMMQAGVFQERDRADQLQQLLARQGLPATVIPAQ